MVNNGYLLGLFGGTSTTGFGSLTSVATPTKKAQPTAPWTPGAVVPDQSALIRGALAGRNIINENNAQLDVPGASSDYRKLFALYQGLDTLKALTERAAVRGVGASEQALLAKRFAEGIQEVSAYLAENDLEGIRLVQGTSATTSKSTAGVPRDTGKIITSAVHEGALASPVAAFDGEVAFDITLQSLTATKTVSIDLTDMGATPRTLDNVINHINGKLADAGTQTRLGRAQLPAETKTVTLGEKTITLPAGADRWALSINGSTTETVSFSAAETADAVYVVQGAGATGGHQLLKFQSDGGTADAPTGPRVGETRWVEGRLSQTGLDAGVETVRASAVGPDGSLWVVADVDAGPTNQPIKGERDVALLKYDSAGRLLATRSLGAASEASGFAIAIDANGRVAVAGSVTGALDTSQTVTTDAKLSDSFVTVFDAQGLEVWTQRRGAKAADEATAVTFGPNGTVHVAGRSQSAMPGAGASGGWDGYLQTFTETQANAAVPITPVASAISQFGTSGDDAVQAVTIDGSNLYTAGVENGRAVVRQFTLDGAGRPTLANTRDLGFIGGDIAGIAVANGQVIVTGQTGNAALDAGTVTRAHSGGTDAFIASLSIDLAAAGTDRLTYYGTAKEDTAADVKIHDGKVWLTGVANRDAGTKADIPSEGYLARLDPTTGAIEYSKTWSGDELQARPLTIAVASGGASVLDRLGLPTGPIAQTDSKLLTANTALRVGDRFTIAPADGGRAKVVTIDAKDTLQTLASKIEAASNRTLKVTVLSEGGYVTGRENDVNTTAGGFQRLSITARDGRSGAILTPGEPGRDALAGLGLSAGFIGKTTGDDTLKAFGLDLSRTLSFDSDPLSIKSANEKITNALTAIRSAYRGLDPASTKPAVSGEVPAYLTAQLANYQAALSRLTGT